MSTFRILKLVIPFFYLSVPAWRRPIIPSVGSMYLGDSLSDTGNLASIAGDFPAPPFFMNRVSNGPVAVEVLAARLGLDAAPSLHLSGPAVGSNYAVAGANSNLADLDTQLTAFLANHGFVAPAAALYVFLSAATTFEMRVIQQI